ncbi:hypothetical protein CYMTET_38860 [Cymbomonas tetramitiformis]|uniref:Uncharacterized protein n=1 Tax=Cymbomonas tetramitiformis TaxID=36881 RepID=A0AAE0CCN3_9CHLO|nr:hypothetical protein CYMTET_38860 [Cymbomonas tetramitiformis]
MLFDPYMDSAQVVKRQLLTLGLRLYSDAPLASGIMTLQTAFMPQASTIRRPCMTDSSPFPVSTSFYPARYDRLGFSDAPKHQGDMAQVFKPVLNGTAHADDGRSECTGIFVDDGHRVYDRDLDSQTVTLSEDRAGRYNAALCKLLRKYPPGAQVLRRELAGVVDKLQFVAPLIVGGQNMLAPAYAAWDAFVNPLGAAGWYAAPYTGFGRAYQKAYTRVFPDQGDAGHYGGGSPRKSLGQWLWTYGWPHRVISAAGGWYTSKVAMHLYFTPHSLGPHASAPPDHDESTLPKARSFQAAMHELAVAMGGISEARRTDVQPPPHTPADRVKRLSHYYSS